MYGMFAMLSFVKFYLVTSVIAHPTLEKWNHKASVGSRSNVKAPISLPLMRKPGKSISYSLLRKLSSRSVSQNTSNSSPLSAGDNGQVFLTPISFGSENFLVVVDTGSSDTWLVRRGFACISATNGMREGQAECAFGHQYTESSTFTQILGENFNVSYGDGEFLRGIVGYEQVCLGNVTVPLQEVGVVDYAAWEGDGESSGILGLAYPSLTSAWDGSEQNAGDDSVQEEYLPVFTNMVIQGLIEEPIFSLAIERDENSGGILTLGGLPDVAYADEFAVVPIEELQAENGSDEEYSFYAINIDGFPNPITSSNSGSESGRLSYPRWPNITNVQAIVDSGTTLIYLPNAVSNAINNLFSPKAQYDATTETWFVSCNATAPTWSLKIGGQAFNINPADMVVGGLDDTCVSGVQDAFGGVSILGDVFLKNVLVVFDIGSVEMRFAERQ